MKDFLLSLDFDVYHALSLFGLLLIYLSLRPSLPPPFSLSRSLSLPLSLCLSLSRPLPLCHSGCLSIPVCL